MSAVVVTVTDAAGSRVVDADGFPAPIGGPGSALALPGHESRSPVAWLGVADEHVFVQPAEGGPALAHNGVRLHRSAWLRDGDELAVAGFRLRCTAAAGQLELALAVEGSPAAGPVPVVVPPDTTPPVSPSPVSASAGVARPGRAAPGPVAPAAAPLAPAARARRGPRLALWGAFVLLVLAGAYVFTASPVSIAITPAPDRVAVDGFLPSLELGGRRLMVPGVYRLRAELAGYHALAETIEVRTGERLDLAYALRKLPGRLVLATEPGDGVEVTVDGEAAGTTPLGPLVLEAGPHELVLARPRYRTLLREVEIEGLGREQPLNVALEPLWAAVSFSSTPPGAAIWRGEEALGVTPFTVDLLEGEHALEARLERHDPLAFEIAVEARRPLAISDLALRESDGVIALVTRPAGASASVDGRFVGRTPTELRLRPGQAHRLVVALAGHSKVERMLDVEPAQASALSIELPRLYGTVFVAATPADAELLVDGKPRGRANQRLRLSAVPHEIEIRRDGFEPFRTRVTPRPGASLEVKTRLATREQASAARTPPELTTGAGQRLKLVRPQGQFTMGASRREQGARANEYRRLVELTRPFYIGFHEVTSAEFRAFRPAHRAGLAGSHSLDGDRQPVVGVSWNDVVEYLNWLSARDGLAPAYVPSGETFELASPPTAGYRLPTEAEWAFVARFSGGRSDRFPWPGGFPPAAPSGNYADRSAAGLLPNALPDYDDGFAATAPVGSFGVGAFGVFDIGGNVAEWTGDYYAVYPDAANRLERDPGGPPSGKHRVVRGSSWRHWSISELRLSHRDYSAEPRHDLGFRIARSVE